MANNQNLAMLGQLIGAGNAIGGLNEGYRNAQGRFNQNYYDPYTEFGGQSLSMLKNAMGLNGAQGRQEALGAFQQGPGYQYQMDQGLNALNRSAASRGMLASGNNSMDLMKYGQNLADQGWSGWMDRLGGGAQTGFAAAQGQTGRQGTQAGIDMGYGNGVANVWNNLGNNLGDMYGRQQQGGGNQVLGGIMGGLNLAARVLPAFL